MLQSCAEETPKLPKGVKRELFHVPLAKHQQKHSRKAEPSQAARDRKAVKEAEEETEGAE